MQPLGTNLVQFDKVSLFKSFLIYQESDRLVIIKFNIEKFILYFFKFNIEKFISYFFKFIFFLRTMTWLYASKQLLN